MINSGGKSITLALAEAFEKQGAICELSSDEKLHPNQQ
jgi:hypothetical protein